MAHGNNTNPIPGELRSVATDGVVASADAIKDYKKGKFQEKINEEVDTEIENIKGGSTDSIASLKTAINNEKSRAQNAESGLQNSINTEKNRAQGAESNLQNAVNAEKSRAQGAETTLQNNINAEKTRAEGVEATKANAADVYTKAQGTAFEGEVNNAISQQNTNIANKFAQQDAAINSKFNQQDATIDGRLDAQDEKIDTLEKQDVEVVEDHEAVENPDPKTIYREPSEDKTSYTDWMYQDGWIELATHSFPGIDEEPTEDSPNVVKSGGLAAYYGSYKESPEFIKVELDEEDKVLEGMRNDGTKVIGGDLLVNGDAKVIGETEIGGVSYKVVENPEWIRMVVDSEDKILCGIKQNGKFYADIDGIDEQVKELIKPLMDEVEELVNRFDEIFKLVENPEYMSVELDSEEKVLGGRKIDGTKFENVGLDLGGAILKGVNDLEGRMEIKTDSDEKIISYRKDDGTLVENAGIEAISIKANSLNLTNEGQKAFEDKLKEDGIGKDIEKQYYLPKFGKVTIKNETFYLKKVDGVSSINDVHVEQVLEDTQENATLRVPISRYFKNGSNEYVMSFAGSDVSLVNGVYIAKVEVIKRSGKCYFSSTIGTANGSTEARTVIIDGYSIETENDPSMSEGDTKKVNIEVVQVSGTPDINTWEVHKKREHYCTADIDFGTYYTKNNDKVGIKYQGSYSTSMRKRGFRITFYKNSDYKKKVKVKIGEFVRISGFNMKSYAQDPTRVKDPVLSNLFIEIWNTRGNNAYPWNKDSVIYNGATGMIKSFPIETYIGSSFFGLQFFSLKKDEKNYMLDGDHDASGIFVSGDQFRPWEQATSRDWEDELDADDKVPAYTDLGDRTSVSVETAEALDTLFAFIGGWLYKNPDDSLYIKKYLIFYDADGNYYMFNEVEVVNEELVVKADNSIKIKHVYRLSTMGRVPTEDSIIVTPVSGTDTYEDGQGNIYPASQVSQIQGTYYVTSTLGYEILPTTLEVTRVPFDEDNVGDYIDAASFIDYFICMQVCQGWDNNYHNMILHTRADKKLFYLFMYDLDNTLGAVYNYDVLTDRSGSESLLWIKFFNIFKDSIINRYAELRKNVLKDGNIKAIYDAYVEGIPERVASAERSKWGYASFDGILNLLKNRLNWLDETYFNLINY